GESDITLRPGGRPPPDRWAQTARRHPPGGDAMNPQLWWQVTRAGGLVAYGLLAASTIWGLAVSTRLLGRWPTPGWTLDLHRYLGGLALTFTGIHLAALLLDSYIQFDVLDLLVPFAAAWRPGAVAWGVVAVYLLGAGQGASLAPRPPP